MKRITYTLAAVALLATACQQPAPTTVRLHGQLTDMGTTEVTMRYDGAASLVGDSRDITLHTDADGCFDTTLTITGPTYYSISRNTLYLTPGDDLEVNITQDNREATFAGRVEIRNSSFRDLSGDAINYAAERDDKGRYNADDMVIENCSFHRILGLPINIYRGGSDESTAGPYVTIRRCNFEDCCNKERGSVMRLVGPQVLDITGCNFSNSGRGGRSIRLDEATWEKVSISDCNFWNAGGILSMTGNAVKGKLYELEPAYVDAEHFDFAQQADSPLARLGIGVKKE